MVPVYIGTSGWYYDHWEEVLYPPGLAKNKRFEVYVKSFNSVEINATFYRFPSERMVNSWAEKAPEGFQYAVKAHRKITHFNKLKNTEEILKGFLTAISPLKEKLGIVLFQLPPGLKKDLLLLKDFVQALPRTPQCCIEFRHPSWEIDPVFELLAGANVGHVIVSKEDYPFIEKHTANFAYYRLHGPEKMFSSPYSITFLNDLGDKIQKLSKAIASCFVFFNNDVGGHAVRNALQLKEIIQKPKI